MGTARISEPAHDDLEEVWAHISQQSESAANRLIDRIVAMCDLYATQPEAGVPGDRFLPGLRYFAVGSYGIFYQVISDGIIVARVLHGARDLDAIFRHPQ